MATLAHTPIVLAILDGFGIAPPSRGNAIDLARTPNLDRFISSYPAYTLQAAGESVGLPWGEMGNSEVGHLSMGSGKILYQDLPRITRAISNGAFFQNPAFAQAVEVVKARHARLHLIGVLSTGGVHGIMDHLLALVEYARTSGLTDVFIHGILDGRDTPSQSGKVFVEKLLTRLQELGVGRIVTLSGRFWAMDRDNRWDRIARAYRAIVEGKSDHTAPDPIAAIEASYAAQVFDEEFVPTVLTDAQGKPLATVGYHDAVIFTNFRPDRARQLTKAFVLPGFEKFPRGEYLKDLTFVTMTQYEEKLPVTVAFPPEKVETPLAKILADHGLKQLHIAETEKYAHVTFFFNGGEEKAFPGEDHVLIPSPAVVSYDQKPSMSAREITQRVVTELAAGTYQFYVINFANADMVAHTGNLPATVAAIETLDTFLGEIATAVLDVGGVLLITADHGNAEGLLDLQTGRIDKEHSATPVPFIVVGREWEGKGMGGPRDLSGFTPLGVLADVAPTILRLFGLPIPRDFTGRGIPLA